MYDLATFKDHVWMFATATHPMRFKHNHQNYFYREIVFSYTNKDLKKESPRDVTFQKGVKNICIFVGFWSCWENPSKIQGAAEKNKEQVDANCTGFSVEFFGSQSVENKNLNIDNFFRELEKNPPTAFKSLGIYL